MTPVSDATLEQATHMALMAEIAYAKATRLAVWTCPAHDQVKRLIAAAWPVLDAARQAGDSND